MNPLIIVLIITLVVLIYLFIKYLASNPNTLTTLTSAKTSTIISSDDLETNGSSASSSNFSYSVWFYINDWNYRYGEPKVIFGRMGGQTASTDTTSIAGVSGIDPCPVVVLDSTQNNLLVSLGCYPGDNQEHTSGGNTVIHTCSIANVPIQKWVNLTVSVYSRTMDLYLDGKLVKTCLLPGIANINNNANVFVTPSGGFDGWTSRLQYYAKSLNPQEAWNIYVKGYNSWSGNIFGSYSFEMSLVENGTKQGTVTI